MFFSKIVPLFFLVLFVDFLPNYIYGKNSTSESFSLGEDDETLNLFRERLLPKLAVAEKIYRHKQYTIYTGALKIESVKDLLVKYEYYQNTVTYGRIPLLFLFPGISGVTPLDRFIARYFVKQGYNVVLSHYFEGTAGASLKQTRCSAFRTLRSGFMLVDHFIEYPQVDKQKIGLLGYSFGGIRGAYQMGLDPRIKAASLWVAGGPLEEVMVKSQLIVVRKIRRKHMLRVKIENEKDYLLGLHEHMHINLEELLQKRKPEDFFMYISNHDSWVPTFTQWKLWSLLNKPQFRVFACGHVSTPVLVSWKYLPTVKAFFEKRWKACGNS